MMSSEQKPRRSWLWLLLLFAGGCRDGAGLTVPPLVFAETNHWPRRADYPGVGKGRLVVTNSYDDTVSLFDLERVRAPDFGELTRIPVGLNPVELEGVHHAAIDPRGEFFYVGISNFRPGAGSGPHGAHGTGTLDGHALKIRASDNVRVGQVRVDPNPGDLVVSPDGRTLFLSHFNILKVSEVSARGGTEREMDARLAVVDTETMTRRAMVPMCPAPHGLRFSPDGNRLYAACYSDEVAVVQLDDPTFPVTRVKVASNAGPAIAPVYEPYALTVSPTTGAVWVSSLKSSSVQVIDPVTLQADPSRRVQLLGIPYFGAFSSDGSRLYVPERGNERVVVVDPSNGKATGSLALPGCQNAHQVLLTPDDATALVVCEGNQRDPGSLLVLDLKDAGKVLRTLPLGVFPDFVGILRSVQ